MDSTEVKNDDEMTEEPPNQEWETIEQERADELRKRLVDQKSYKLAIAAAQKVVDSGSTSSATTQTAPNLVARTPKL